MTFRIFSSKVFGNERILGRGLRQGLYDLKLSELLDYWPKRY